MYSTRSTLHNQHRTIAWQHRKHCILIIIITQQLQPQLIIHCFSKFSHCEHILSTLLPDKVDPHYHVRHMRRDRQFIPKISKIYNAISLYICYTNNFVIDLLYCTIQRVQFAFWQLVNKLICTYVCITTCELVTCSDI